ncbi:MAG: ChaB family protein [Deltaproteobacteria bacterium]|nr:ChaB family protein [Deltaproteobacteria bacterium]
MPFNSVSELPDTTRGLPIGAKNIYMKAFNSAFEQATGDDKDITATKIAWAAVKRSYKKENDKWIRREAMNLSNKNKENLLQSALVKEYGIQNESPIPKNLSIEEVFESEVVYNVDGQLYKSSFELNEDNIVFGEPEKVLSTRIFRTKEALSMENRRALLTTALHTHLGLSKDDHLWVEDMTEAEVFYNHDQQPFKVNYTITEDGAVTFGEPVKVVRQVIFKPIESLRETYSEIIQEAGRRNASLDSVRIKKILTLCQELLSSEAEQNEKKVESVVKQAKAVLAELKEQASMKTEDGVKFPAQAYAYVPDPEKSSTWKLRLWEDLEKKVTRAQLGRAAAALSPGGFRGQKVQIPSADLSAVKRKIRAEYRKLDVEDEDIPRWVKEVETRQRLYSFTPLTEAAANEEGRAQVIVIKPGFNATEDRYYPAEVLKRDYTIFEGQKMYADHPTEEEDNQRPERSIRDWVATLTEVKVDDAGVVTGVAVIVEAWLKAKLSSLRDQKMLSEMGISINAVGSATKATIDGKETLVIEKLVAAKSVDFVTEPGAGGIVTFYESDRGQDIDLVDLGIFKEKRPDLVKIIEANVRTQITKEVKKAMENEEKITELEGQIETLTTERDGLKEAALEAEKDKAKAEAQATIKEAVDKAELPNAAKERLIERFKDAESADGISEAITSEIDYISKLAESGTVKNLGPSKNETEKDTEALRESVKKANPEWSDEQVEAFVNPGR